MVKIRTTIILSVVAMLLGFCLGKLSFIPENAVEVRESVKYITSNNIIHDTITEEKLVPIVEMYSDTVIKYLNQPVDTVTILKDYFLSRKYSLDFSNDTVGVFKVDAEVNQNRLVAASSFIQPITKTIIQEKNVYYAPTIQFYGILGTSADLNTNKISLGIDFKQSYLFGISGMRFNNKYNYTIDFGIKF